MTRHPLQAGKLRGVLEDGALRHLRWDGEEVLRGVAYLFRDRDWGTPPPRITDLVVDASSARFTATLAGFRWRAAIALSAEGRLNFTVEGEATAPVETNRCGFVVLHPAHCAGRRLLVTHTDGRKEDTEFPMLISPGQPVLEIRALRHEVAAGLAAALRLEAELPQDPDGKFEMEDQRNWSDASFKTYAGSLLDPWPYRLEPGRVFRQCVSLAIEDRRPTAPALRKASPGLEIGRPSGALMPSIGLEAPAGFTGLPLQPQWLVARLEGDLDALARSGVSVQLEIVVPETAAPGDALAAAAARCAEAGLRPTAVLPCPAPLLLSHQPAGPWPDLPPLEDYYRAARAAFPEAHIGGGMLTYFTELNRCRPNGEAIDFISHATAPIVHAADDQSVMETLEALPAIAHSVRAIWPRLAYRVGPSALAMRSNPYGAATVPNPEGHKVPLADRDPRQSMDFAAAWAVGYAAALAPFGLEMLALNATHGPSGLEPSWPIFRVMQALIGAAGKRHVAVRAPAGLAVLAWEEGEGIACVIANLTAEDRVALGRPMRPYAVVFLDRWSEKLVDRHWRSTLADEREP